MDLIEKLLPVLVRYPGWVKIFFSLWLLQTAAVMLSMIFAYPGKEGPVADKAKLPPIERAKAARVDFNKAVDDLLQPPKEVSERFGDLLTSQRSGVIRLLSQAELNSTLEQLGYSGGGSHYSFTRRTHEYGHGSDISIEQGRFTTGFAGADFGYIVNLGEIPVRRVLDSPSETPPSWLAPELRDAWEYVWSYRPPTDIKEIREAQKNAKGLKVGNSVLSEEASAAEGHSYLLRSIAIQEADILVAMHVASVTPDGEYMVVWRVLKTFPTPIATGRE